MLGPELTHWAEPQGPAQGCVGGFGPERGLLRMSGDLPPPARVCASLEADDGTPAPAYGPNRRPVPRAFLLSTSWPRMHTVRMAACGGPVGQPSASWAEPAAGRCHGAAGTEGGLRSQGGCFYLCLLGQCGT